MGNTETKLSPIYIDGWTLLSNEISYWGTNMYTFYFNPDNEYLKISIDPRKNGNYRLKLTSSKDDHSVETSMTNSLDKIIEFLQKRYGKDPPTSKLKKIDIDI